MLGKDFHWLTRRTSEIKDIYVYIFPGSRWNDLISAEKLVQTPGKSCPGFLQQPTVALAEELLPEAGRFPWCPEIQLSATSPESPFLSGM